MNKGTPNKESSQKPQNRKRSPKFSQYDRPLPYLDVVKLPPLVPYNPFSWLNYAVEYFFPCPPPAPARRLEARIERAGRVVVVRVDNGSDQARLWREGFFGKGVYSRSDPAWFARTARRLDLAEAAELALTAEERTTLRRLERARFKEERARLENERLDRVRRREMGEDVELLPDDAKVDRALFTNTGASINSEFIDKRSEDELLLDENGKLVSVEYVQLMPYEAIFLSEFLHVLDIRLGDDSDEPLHGWDLVRALLPAGESISVLIANYAAYHSFRAKGWCARSGVKFASDFVLYRRGPPFTHADFTVTVHPVVPEESQGDHRWYDATRTGRVVGGVKKTMLYCYVEVPSQDAFDGSLAIREVLERCKVTTVSHIRWRPMKCRD
ncbi:uncharacterized protein SAPINGB_P005518 [Magnusiomyces paraingens]|uniref:tRNA-splicing endonuclease subunit Sen2 n=1 Tax=Magnusiomyces paraingens TaxID=2606893 RepID=A0A5E8C5E0_9ASCO|nr:uncharacterized protein SAPINGB_P005518 [Saprochaete ingens]VVT57068.1 unnamed protein product [Saprochaete ingens]